ncbi:MAG: hypothetical protein J1F36_05440 [Clostridiales bacterium]|nr:hypothetical protein [Clostridiales bacterium]
MSKIKKVNWLTCAVIALVMALSCLSFAVAPSVRAEEVTDFTAITVSDNQFNASGSKVLKTSTNWTGGYIGGFKGNVISGIVDLSASADTDDDFMEATQLDRYNEFKSKKPTTPFGKDADKYPGTNTKVLMINTNDIDSKRGTAYGYTSSSIELSANSFYKFSVWAKTGAFTQNRGAVIKLSGFEYDIGFWNIDNSSEINNSYLGFCEYVIYVATAQNSVSATIKLQVGDSYTYGEIGEPDYIEYVTPSSGYAFFDNITCYQLSANLFYEEASVQNKYTVVEDFNTSAAATESKLLTTASGEVGSFKNGLTGWERIFKEDISSGQYLYANTYDAGITFNADNGIGLESAPYTPRGNRDFLDDRNILVMSAETPANVGFESEDIKIERNTFYRLSVWANSQNFESSSNASLVIVGENNIASSEYELTPVVISDVQGSGNINARYGWRRFFFYIRGSLVKDLNIKLQLWLGYDSNCTGTVLFDEIRLEKLTYSYFNNNSSSGTVVTFDNTPSTSIDNGRFYNAENYDDEYPLKPVQWNAIGNVPSSAASGVILTDNDHYSANSAKYFGVANPVSEASDVTFNSVEYPTMLLLATRENAYFGYSSPTITITTGNDYKISVTMRTIDMTGAGANLWLEVNGITIASVTGIMSTPNFTTYEFYLQGDVAFSSGTGTDYSVTLNIAMGTANKKATGSIYIAEAALDTLASGKFDEKYAEFKADRRNNLPYDMYSFSSLDFFGYDASDENAIKKTTSWTISDSAEQSEGNYEFGVFDPHNKTGNNGTYLPDEITTAYDNLENKFGQIFTIHARNTAVTAQLINPLKLEADSYYMVSVSMAVILHDGNNSANSYGAGLYLSGTDYSGVRFTDIKTTENLVDKYEFRTYQFYLASASEIANVYLNVSLGDPAYPNRYVSGEVYIAYVSLVNLGSSDEDIEENEYLKIINNHVDSSDEEDDDKTDDTTTPANDSEKWWVIPSILFGIAIVLAIVGVVIRTIVDKVSRRQRRKQLNSYDRRYGYAVPESSEHDEFDEDNTETANNKVVIDQEVEAFNDDEPETVKEEKVEVKKPAKAPKKRNDSNVNDDFDE